MVMPFALFWRESPRLTPPDPHCWTHEKLEAAKSLADWRGFFIGGARRNRTDDLLHAMQALSQLSYGPETCFATLGCDERRGN
jgi:hypothetical protein